MWEGTAAMNPAINGSEPLDLQNVTMNPAAELRTRGRGLRTPTKLARNPSKNGSTQMFNTNKRFFLSK